MFKSLAIGCGMLLVSFHSASSEVYPNSCEGLPDGLHQLKLLEDDSYPVVELQCSNNYAILDVNQDSNLQEYFTSWAMWHYAIAGPTNDDHVNWKNWYIPSSVSSDDESHDFIVSSDCSVCSASSAKADDDDSYTIGKSATYMTGNLYGCFWKVRGLHDCDMDWDSYTCYECDCDTNLCNKVEVDLSTLDTDSDDVATGTCATLQKSVTLEVAESHDDCTSESGKYYKPSIGTDGRNCMCVRPTSGTSFFEADEEQVNAQIALRKHEKELKALAEAEDSDNSESKTFYLHQKDFTFGTYRIQEAGTYIIMEDIEFDFNNEVNNKDGRWMPQSSQSDDYPGAQGLRDPYFLGFFAGITVEADDVVLDLNGKTLRQSTQFYHQQRWFSIIELANQPFLPAQGPGFFGDTVKAASNVEVKNGVLGLTSHHGIHGNKNNDVKIHDIEIKHFETHGIQLNGFSNVEIYNVEIHSSSQKAYLKGEYGHALWILPRLKAIYEENPTKTISLPNYDDPVTMKEIYEDMGQQVNIAYEYVINKNKAIKDEVDPELWDKVNTNFLYLLDSDDDVDDVTSNNDAVETNANGLPYGTAMYGIFLSFDGANVFSWGSSVLKSTTAKIKNVKIHGLRHKMHEYLRFHNGIPFDVNPFNAVFDINQASDNPAAFELSSYQGNIMTDAYVAMNYMTDDWGYLGMQNLNSGGLVDWALGNDQISSDDYTLKCNSDVMTHSAKGTIAMRLDGIEELEIDNVEIYDIYDYTKSGSNKCGKYSNGLFTDGGHFLQKKPMQDGFSGNMVQGISLVGSTGKISNINVHDIGSATGLAFGLAIWTSNEIELNGDIKNTDIKAGFHIEQDTYEYADRPNKAPEACGVMTYWAYNANSVTDYTTDNETLYTTVTTGDADSLNIVSQCVTGHAGCFNNDEFGATTLGSYVSCQEAQSMATAAIKDEFLTNIDYKLLATRDETSNLVDFSSRLDSLGFDDSYTIFQNTDNSQYNTENDDPDDPFVSGSDSKFLKFKREEVNVVKAEVVRDVKQDNVDVISSSSKNSMNSNVSIIIVSAVLLSMILFYAGYRLKQKNNGMTDESGVAYGTI